ncbi:hypothetical protein N658DRAFT_493232 [Parathielavia hyrcaniae]|uniref:Uncharacterized protein n=1 Tax=Parathielavia hyrcaniae TaxID=113614 RepID=A0AAN6Q7P6_9PEZI|nr:hypothetical protein N658DRAFT_493232 [Parathielavia hyrcaniae]
MPPLARFGMIRRRKAALCCNLACEVGDQRKRTGRLCQRNDGSLLTPDETLPPERCVTSPTEFGETNSFIAHEATNGVSRIREAMLSSTTANSDSPLTSLLTGKGTRACQDAEAMMCRREFHDENIVDEHGTTSISVPLSIRTTAESGLLGISTDKSTR